MSAATRVIVLGGTGMLGSMVVDVLARDPGFEVTATARTEAQLAMARLALPAVKWVGYDAERPDPPPVEAHDWAINAIGIIKPLIKEDSALDVARAIRVNALFPQELADLTAKAGARVIQIATDCVYSGLQGSYVETAPHDALDVYGKTKSLGEVRADNFMHVRCSIVGPEVAHGRSLLSWLLSQPAGAVVPGFSNHMWNGVTTFHFAKVARGIMRSPSPWVPVEHLIPAEPVTKADLLRYLASAYGRTDLDIRDTLAPEAVDRTLSTCDPERNRAMWQAAGYTEAPTIPVMTSELATFRASWSAAAALSR